MNFIKNFFSALIILLLVFVLFLDRCGKKPEVKPPSIIRDTVWIHHDSIIYAKPKPTQTIPPTQHAIQSPQFVPDTNYIALVKQYNKLLILYLQKNVQKDKLLLKDLGYVNVTDTVYENLVQGRSYEYHIEYPQVTEHITMYPKPKNQFYIGGSLQGSILYPVNQINAGLLLKNRKDQIFGVYTGINKDGQLQLGVSSYWKIKLSKN
jgi:hypothetical protein